MHLFLTRGRSKGVSTISPLLVDGYWHSWVLEDVIRETGQPVAQWKVPSKTAIPCGLYRVTLTHSQRFNRILPLVNDVPGFTGIRIHPGNTFEDTDGCLLPGYEKNGEAVGRSRLAFEELFTLMESATKHGDAIFLTIENPTV